MCIYFFLCLFAFKYYSLSARFQNRIELILISMNHLKIWKLYKLFQHNLIIVLLHFKLWCEHLSMQKDVLKKKNKTYINK